MIRSLNAEDVIPAMDLVRRVFNEFEAPDYSKEGIAEFYRFIEPSLIAEKIAKGEIRLWGAFDKAFPKEIIGVLAIRPPLHIALLFVDERYQRHGIARKLIQTAIDDGAANGIAGGTFNEAANGTASGTSNGAANWATGGTSNGAVFATQAPITVTVNSSPYAVEIYRRMGFIPIGTEKTVNGLRFTPMERKS